MPRKFTSKGRRQQYTPPLVPAPAPVEGRKRAMPEAPTSGYVLVVDGQMKETFTTHDAARERGTALKQRFPALQVKIFDAETKHTENVARADA